YLPELGYSGRLRVDPQEVQAGAGYISAPTVTAGDWLAKLTLDDDPSTNVPPATSPGPGPELGAGFSNSGTQPTTGTMSTQNFGFYRGGQGTGLGQVIL